MKKILILFLCLCQIIGLTFASSALVFSDTASHKNTLAIDALSTIGVVEGYGDNIFNPDANLTRAELCTMLVRALHADNIHYDNVNRFSDVPLNHWARMYVDTAYRNNLMVGNGDGTFEPEVDVTYTQVARTILNSLGYGALAWPDGVNLVALELDLYKNVNVRNYETPCTRAHAVQMIYNAFDLELVKDYAGIPMRTGKTFLADLLGYEEIIVSENGTQYVGYKNLVTNKIYRTMEILTTETAIFPVNGTTYTLTNSWRAERYTIDWTKVSLYVNGTPVFDNLKNRFAAAEIAYGVFDVNDNLVSIRIVNPGITYIPALEYNTGLIPAEVMNRIQFDPNYNQFTSTITYYEESGAYEISNKIVAGYVTNINYNTIWVDEVPYNFNTSGILFQPIYMKYVVMYFNVHDQLISWQTIEDPYIFDMSSRVAHTMECEAIQQVYPGFLVTRDRVFTHAIWNTMPFIPEWIVFDGCPHCHTNGKNTVVIAEKYCYIKDGGSHYHMDECSYYINNQSEMQKVTIADAIAQGYVNECSFCKDKFN